MFNMPVSISWQLVRRLRADAQRMLRSDRVLPARPDKNEWACLRDEMERAFIEREFARWKNSLSDR